jgi:murein DD-endopeptidase MepM/ murein hydrolase activator NlpD/ketosteroid isomerase-like protein
VVLALLLGATTLAAQTAVDSVRALDSAWARAYAVHDTATAQSLFARDIIITNSAGRVKTREQELGDVRPIPGLTMAYFRTEDVGIHLFAGNAVVVGNAQWEFAMGGQAQTLRRRYTARYSRGGPLGWQMVALHLFLAPAAAPAMSPAALAAAGPEGKWEGRLRGNGLRLVLDLTKAADGLYLGTFTSVDQGGARFPIDRIVVTGDSLHFEVRSVGGTYDAVLSADRTRLTGFWSQGGRIPLDLTRIAAAAPPAPEPAANPATNPLGLAADLTVPVRPIVFAGAGRRHLAYELHLTNYSGAAILLSRLEVLGDTTPLARYEGAELNAIVAQRRPNVTDNRDIPPGGWAVVYVWVTLDSAAKAPRNLRHRVTAGGQSLEGMVAVETASAVVVGPPLRGADWVAMNGPGNDAFHRRALIPIGGQAVIAQRFAIDWARTGSGGRMFAGDEKDNKSYFAHGADVLAVADGIVASVKDGIPENVPGATSRAVPITLETVGGNSVILDLGGGRYAFYAHLVPGSLRVKTGDRVKRGQLLGLVGNSGNSTGPHLHFHIADRNAGLGAEGLPYVIDAWELMRAPGTWERRTNEIPMQNARARFPEK